MHKLMHFYPLAPLSPFRVNMKVVFSKGCYKGARDVTFYITIQQEVTKVVSTVFNGLTSTKCI